MRSPRPAFCPTSKQPELKHAAVKVLRAELPWRLVARAWLDRLYHNLIKFRSLFNQIDRLSINLLCSGSHC